MSAVEADGYVYYSPFTCSFMGFVITVQVNWGKTEWND